MGLSRDEQSLICDISQTGVSLCLQHMSKITSWCIGCVTELRFFSACWASATSVSSHAVVAHIDIHKVLDYL